MMKASGKRLKDRSGEVVKLRCRVADAFVYWTNYRDVRVERAIKANMEWIRSYGFYIKYIRSNPFNSRRLNNL